MYSNLLNSHTKKDHQLKKFVSFFKSNFNKSNSKLFSSSSTTFGSKPNSQVSLVDAAMPGMLPVINKYCIEQAIKTGIGLNAKINNYSVHGGWGS